MGAFFSSSMIPLKDNIPSRTVPVVNYGIIAICTLTFLGQLSQGGGGVGIVERYGMIPARVIDPDREITIREARPMQTREGVRVFEVTRPAAPAAVAPWLTLATSMFLHGGWLHFLGNMWFLYIFGDNVEDRLGHLGYLLFYVAAGVLAGLAHLLSNSGSQIPTIGASGAIAGVMGAYLYLYPHAKVLAVIPIFIILEMVVLPAPLFLGFWFFLQFFQGMASISSTQAAGVAWWAHIGGFVVGLVAAALLGACHLLRSKVKSVRPGTDHVTAYRLYPRRP